MIPRMSLKEKILAWLLWKLNGWNNIEDAEFDCLKHPELSRMAGLCRDRFYILQAKHYDRMQRRG